MTFDFKFYYRCDHCGSRVSTDVIQSFICGCGGSFIGESNIYTSTFKPYYSREMKAHVNSSKHEEKLLRKKGYAFLSDHKSLKNEAAYIRKHKSEITEAAYAKDGVKFDPVRHKDKQFDEKKGEFVSKAFAVILILLLCCSTAEARFSNVEGIEYATIKVNGQNIEIPIGNVERKQEIYFLKKALEGDKAAREIFLGGNDERWFPIGDEQVVWLLVDKDSERVIKP